MEIKKDIRLEKEEMFIIHSFLELINGWHCEKKHNCEKCPFGAMCGLEIDDVIREFKNIF